MYTDSCLSLTQILQGIVVSQVVLQMQGHVVAQLLHGVAFEVAWSPLTNHLEVVESLSCHHGGDCTHRLLTTYTEKHKKTHM